MEATIATNLMEDKMSEFHWFTNYMLTELRLADSEDKYERGFMAGQMIMARHVDGLPKWQRLYIENVHRAKFYERLTGV